MPTTEKEKAVAPSLEGLYLRAMRCSSMFRVFFVATTTICLVACSKPPSAPDAASADPPASAAPLPSASPQPLAASVPQPPTASPPPTAPPTSAQPVASAAPAESPVPKVKVVNIGMHIGGITHDDPVAKEPIKKSVEPHFDAFRRCWGLLGDPAAKGDFGIDLRVEKEGGRAKAEHPRTALKGKPFQECMVTAFTAIDFLKPRTGTTNVSYSLRFSPN